MPVAPGQNVGSRGEGGRARGKHLYLLSKPDLQGLSGEQGAGEELSLSVTAGLSNIHGGGP